MSQDRKIQHYVNILRRIDIFYDLSPSQQEKLAAICSEAEYGTGELIFEENTPGRQLFVIASGQVEIQLDPSLIRPGGRGQGQGRTTIATLRTGQTFGEVTLVDRGLRTASACSAADRTHLLILPRDELLELCDEDPELGYRLMRNIAAELAFKIRGTDLMIREQLLWKPAQVKK
jgi:CRP-like cAMP-binding protein